MNDVNISGLTYPGQKINPGNLASLLTGGGFNLITFVFFIAGAVFLFSLLQAAWGYVNSTGDQKKVAEATSRLLNAFFGIIIVLASFIVVRLILAVLGISDILNIS
jgi:lysylphosphatidylglycerol synthetase-like protein (DUF2156 family)